MRHRVELIDATKCLDQKDLPEDPKVTKTEKTSDEKLPERPSEVTETGFLGVFLDFRLNRFERVTLKDLFERHSKN